MKMLNKAIRFFSDKKYRFYVLEKLGFYQNIDDVTYLSKKYKIIYNRNLNLYKPVYFSEKLQWLKLYDRKHIYTKMVDKYEAKKYVASIIGEEYIVPTYGIWDRFNEIDFSTLPDQFVLKCTHDSGGLFIIKNKSQINKKVIGKKIESDLKKNYYFFGREWPYKDVKPKIIAEQYLEDRKLNESVQNMNNLNGLVDYKFFCFNNEPMFLYISRGLDHHPTAEISFYDLNGKELYFHRSDYKPFHNALMPSNFEEMKSIAKKIAKHVDCPFVRIDLYSINERVYFSEITFSPCSGMIPFEPKSVDYELGKLLHLPIDSDLQ